MKKPNNKKPCCKKTNKSGFLSGLIYGLMPHAGCIAFIIFAVLGTTTATVFFKPFLLNPYLFYILIILSLIFATLSALFYFKNQGFITLSNKEGLEISFLSEEIKGKWKYLSALYGTTISINLLLFMVIFPYATNFTLTGAFTDVENPQSALTLQVSIPCPGHAPLITEEFRAINGITGVQFRFPNLFDVSYDPEKTSKKQILSLEVFKTYKATVVE